MLKIFNFIKMKKILLFIIYFTTFALNLHAMDYDEGTKQKLKKMGVYFGDPSENVIIGTGEMYLIIYNPTELSFTLMGQEAKKYCKENLGNHYTSNYKKPLGRYTAYYSCEVQNNKIDQYNLTKEEKNCIKDRLYAVTHNPCRDLNKKNSELIDLIQIQNENEDTYKTNIFIYHVRSKFYKKIIEFENTAENKRLNDQIQKNIIKCKKYNFEIGTQGYNNCILKLIEKN